MSNHNPPTNGLDKRKGQINRKGRPKTFGELRELAQQIAHEEVKAGDKRLTVIEAILRQWAQSKDPRLVQAYVAYAYGKPPDVIQGDQEGGPVRIKITGKKPDDDGV